MSRPSLRTFTEQEKKFFEADDELYWETRLFSNPFRRDHLLEHRRCHMTVYATLAIALLLVIVLPVVLTRQRLSDTDRMMQTQPLIQETIAQDQGIHIVTVTILTTTYRTTSVLVATKAPDRLKQGQILSASEISDVYTKFSPRKSKAVTTRLRSAATIRRNPPPFARPTFAPTINTSLPLDKETSTRQSQKARTPTWELFDVIQK